MNIHPYPKYFWIFLDTFFVIYRNIYYLEEEAYEALGNGTPVYTRSLERADGTNPNE